MWDGCAGRTEARGERIEQKILHPPLTQGRKDFAAPLLPLLHREMPRDRDRETHCKASASPEKDVHWAAGREKGVNPS